MFRCEHVSFVARLVGQFDGVDRVVRNEALAPGCVERSAEGLEVHVDAGLRLAGLELRIAELFHVTHGDVCH